jgi:hypothetical protein
MLRVWSVTNSEAKVKKRGVDDNGDQEPNARLTWIADVVCAILDAESIKRSSSVVKDSRN